MRISRSYALAVGIFVLAGVVGGSLFSRHYTSAQADQADYSARRYQSRTDGHGGGTQWEYCVITRSSASASLPRGTYALSYFRPGGPLTNYIEETATERGALTKAIAKLGEDGWELVGEGPIEFRSSAGSEALYFKRPKR